MKQPYQLKNPLSPFLALTRNANLVLELARRDVIGRYRGSFAGLLWSFFNPLLMLAIYTFVFGYIFKSHWSQKTSGPLDFAMILFAGLNLNTMFSECANRAPTLIIENASFVKRVVFPLETLAWSVVGSALFHLCISTVVLLVFSLLISGSLPWTAVLFPLVIAIFMPFVAGTVWLLASLGVFLRDLKQAIGVMTTALLFLAPVFYSRNTIPPAYRELLYLNPLTVVAESARDVLIWGVFPPWKLLILYGIAAWAFAWAAFAWFQKSRKGFADVL